MAIEEKGPKKLVIIGNGFDLQHDLETRFTDFANYLKEEAKKDENAKETY